MQWIAALSLLWKWNLTSCGMRTVKKVKRMLPTSPAWADLIGYSFVTKRSRRHARNTYWKSPCIWHRPLNWEMVSAQFADTQVIDSQEKGLSRNSLAGRSSGPTQTFSSAARLKLWKVNFQEYRISGNIFTLIVTQKNYLTFSSLSNLKPPRNLNSRKMRSWSSPQRAQFASTCLSRLRARAEIWVRERSLCLNLTRLDPKLPKCFCLASSEISHILHNARSPSCRFRRISA